MAPQTAISKAVCYKTKNEQLWEKAVHFLLVATNCFYAGLPTVFCTITWVLTPLYKKRESLATFSFREPSGIRTHDIQNHNLTL